MHHFEQVINGREYLIEVSSVGLGKWRAQIARVPGGCAALMPFYGKTPDEAASHLTRWLALLHAQRSDREQAAGELGNRRTQTTTDPRRI